MDLSKLSDQDLAVLNSGDYSKLSDDGLKMLHDQTQPVSKLESVGRGALQGATLGYGDEITGGGEAMLNKLMGSHEKLLDLYKKHRDEARANNKKAQEDNPKSYLAGQIGGGAASALATGAVGLPTVGILAGAGAGAAAGLGNSDADLTSGDPSQYGQAAADTAKGGVIGGVIGGVAKGVSALANTGDQTAERLAIKSLNGSPEKTGAMLKGVGNENRDSVGRTLLRNKILGKFGLNTDNGVAEGLQRTSDNLGQQQGAMVDGLADRSASMHDLASNIQNKLGLQMTTTGENAADNAGQQLDKLSNFADQNGNISLKDMVNAKKQWQGLSDYPSAGTPTPQDVSNAAAMTKATGGLRQTIGETAPELNPILRSESNIFQARDAMKTRPDLLSTHGTSMTGMAIRTAKGFGNQVGAVTTDKINQILQSSPQSLGRFAGVLSQSAQRSPESLKATLHVLQMSDPEFRQVSQSLQEPDSQ